MDDWITVESSNLAAYRYDEDERILYIAFSSGAVYAYLAIPTALVAGLAHAESKGKFFHKYIKGGEFAFSKTEELWTPEGGSE